jgi:hypothetical protein
MQVYAFDLMPWPHLAEASYYPDSNGLDDPALGGRSTTSTSIKARTSRFLCRLKQWRCHLGTYAIDTRS